MTQRDKNQRRLLSRLKAILSMAVEIIDELEAEAQPQAKTLCVTEIDRARARKALRDLGIPAKEQQP